MQTIGDQIFWLDSVSSTSQVLLDLLQKEPPSEGTVIAALKQNAGKGMGTNTWESEAYKNLTFSFVLYPDFLPVKNQFDLNKAIALGIADFVKTRVPNKKVSIKWSNDVYVENKKICGVLIQNSLLGQQFDYMVVGVGLNVNQTVFGNTIPNPVSLKQISGTDTDLKKTLQNLCKCLNNRYIQLKNKQIKQIYFDYQNQLFWRDEWHQFSIDGKNMEAKIVSVNAFGQLELLDTENNPIVCNFKEIRFLF